MTTASEQALPQKLEGPTTTPAGTDIGLKNDHNVYILGAGFSREAGLPLINDFLIRMRDSHEWLVSQGRQPEANAVQKVLEFRLKAASAGYYVTMDLENIEELFSLASASQDDMDAPIRIAIAATIDFIRKTQPIRQVGFTVRSNAAEHPLFVIPTQPGAPGRAPIWTIPDGDPDYLNKRQRFHVDRYAFYVARLLGLCLNAAPQGENTFITFNYDTVLENALDTTGVPWDYALGVGFRDSTRHPIPVLKLHGSVNWSGTTPADGGPAIVEVARTYDHVRAVKDPPLLIPPTWKKIFGGSLEGVWDLAVNRLSTATRIVIIGFSMPPTDMHFKYLLAAGLQNNVSLRQILFVNPDEKDELRASVEKLLRKSYIDRGIISFSKTTLGGFTAMHPPLIQTLGSQFAEIPAVVQELTQVDQIGRPADRALGWEVYSA